MVMEFNDETQRQTWLFNMGWQLHQKQPDMLKIVLDIKTLPDHIRKPLEQGRDQFEKDREFINKKLQKKDRLDQLRQLRELGQEQDKTDDLER